MSLLKRLIAVQEFMNDATVAKRLAIAAQLGTTMRKVAVANRDCVTVRCQVFLDGHRIIFNHKHVVGIHDQPVVDSGIVAKSSEGVAAIVTEILPRLLNHLASNTVSLKPIGN